MKEDIKDTEIRIVGADTNNKWKKKWWILLIIPFATLSVYYLLQKQWNPISNNRVQTNIACVSQSSHPLKNWIQSLDTITQQGTAVKDVMVNGMLLRIYVPLNCEPRLEVGYDVIQNRDENILLFQAADVRADNKKIVGAYVLRGQPLSWGLSKRGYCAIIDGQISIGVADNSPLFEQATDQNGYFFRQYPLVDNGVMVENTLKNKYIRRGLCDLDGRIVVAETRTQETMNDFAQALADMGVTNAIYLVGSTAIGWCCDLEGNGTKMGLWNARVFKNVNFIVWSR